ncbi:hypothetical protein HNP89_000962 [Methanococcus maripaludis]|uniref:SMODS-associating 2TM beta-strand rich effector domain-containing protein n=1 Tax=Methanococcus maripaludis TaxID=39152 RepID=A0A7J9P0L3_METMI|nr:hypothetical protein [Methanococcus maripaludis]MBA2853005.1 hypothetical protein [Methanococcus maripaludis]
MHSYSINEPRTNIFKYLGIISLILTAPIINLLKDIVESINSLPGINYMPCMSQITIFGIIFLGLYYFFDKWLWKKTIFGLKFSKIPNLNGCWKGRIKTSYPEKPEIDVKIIIKQTWSSISITLKTDESESESHVALISLSNSRLIYQYLNEPQNTSIDSMKMHYGVTMVKFNGKDILKGKYFTDKNRKNYGDIEVKRI